ncbi:hypothetical protein HMPREF0864_00753 [Enterobacteriaceae bacterium 9_2_54FAA]|nr:hypothetical protein HMPREF0864_00753 [Enterobacteriaceae bacterium 9_2_54FAA]
MSKFTTEITIEELQYRIHAHENDLTQMWTADYFLSVQKELLALKQAAKNPVAYRNKFTGRFFTLEQQQNAAADTAVYEPVFLAAPVLPKQPELVVLTDEQIDAVLDSKANMAYIISDKRERLRMFAREIIRTAMISTAPAQPVIPEQAKREQVRREHAEWSDATFGNVGPVGPLKHLSKEALEAAAAPDDLLEWADMQFLLWDAQRRAGIPDDFITVAMIEKLEINKKRQWPEPKDGEPRLHINTQSAQPVIPEQNKFRDLSQPVDPQISEYEKALQNEPQNIPENIPAPLDAQDLELYVDMLENSDSDDEDGELNNTQLIVWLKELQRRRELPAQPVSEPYKLPQGYALVPCKLTAESGAKSCMIGKFIEQTEISCPECFGDDECETCDGSGTIEVTAHVSWTTIKDIWAKGIEHFAAAPAQESE